MEVFSLLQKECRQILKSIVYVIFVGVVVIFYITQLSGEIKNATDKYEAGEYDSQNLLFKPEQGQDNYGYKEVEDPEQVMPKAVEALVGEYQANHYVAYPVGFYKSVRLSERENKRVAEIIEKITGVSPEFIAVMISEHMQANVKEQGDGFFFYDNTQIVEIPIIVDYELFKGYMQEIDKTIGGGSSYKIDKLSQYGRKALSYEEKIEIYNNFIEKDKVTGAYARLFCDYMGIVIALFSIFVPVSYFMQDKKARMEELICVRRIGSAKLIIARYLANCVMILIPFLILALIESVQLISFGKTNNIVVGISAYAKYIGGWLLPAILFTTAVGTLFTVLTDSPIGIIVQFGFSFFQIFKSGDIGGGDYGGDLALRHNSLGNYDKFKEGFNQIVQNRLIYAVGAATLIIFTIWLYELKRGGKINIGNLLRAFKGTGKASL